MASKKDMLKESMKKAQQPTAASFISKPEEPDPAKKKETKSARTSFLLYPSVYQDFRTLADAMGKSPSELLNDIMRDCVDANRKQIDEWIKFREATAAALKKKT